MKDASRMTRFMQEQTGLRCDAYFKIEQDPELLPYWMHYAYAVLVRLDLPHPVRRALEDGSPDIALPEASDESELLHALTHCARLRIPELEHAYGEHLGPIIALSVKADLAEIAAQEGDIRTKEALLQAADADSPMESYQFKRFLPDNPAEVFPTDIVFPRGIYDNPAVEKLLPFWNRQVRDYARSLRPERKKGRTPGRAKTGGKKPVDPELALRAHQAKQDGMNWQQIARKVLRTSVPSDPKARERLRGNVRTLLAAGKRHSAKI